MLAKLRPDEPKMLIINGCRVHISWEALDALAKANVEVIVLPANSTHATQQLGVVVFMPLKRVLREELAQMSTDMDMSNNKEKKVGIFENAEAISKPEAATHTPANIKRALEETGVEPCNPEKLVQRTRHSD